VVGNSNCPIVDTWWQTETGAHMILPLPGATTLKPGSATLPFFGVEPALLDPESGKEIEGEGEGCAAAHLFAPLHTCLRSFALVCGPASAVVRWKDAWGFVRGCARVRAWMGEGFLLVLFVSTQMCEGLCKDACGHPTTSPPPHTHTHTHAYTHGRVGTAYARTEKMDRGRSRDGMAGRDACGAKPRPTWVVTGKKV
jgi:hypothetical protein